MKPNACIFAVMAVLEVTIWTTRSVGEDTKTTDLTGKYSALIEETIAKCLSKAKHLGSRNPNIR